MTGLRSVSVLNFLILLIKGLDFLFFTLITAYVIICGKNKSGIKLDYLITSVLLWVVLVVL